MYWNVNVNHGLYKVVSVLCMTDNYKAIIMYSTPFIKDDQWNISFGTFFL